MLSDPTPKLVWRMLSLVTLVQIIKISKVTCWKKERFSWKKNPKWAEYHYAQTRKSITFNFFHVIPTAGRSKSINSWPSIHLFSSKAYSAIVVPKQRNTLDKSQVHRRAKRWLVNIQLQSTICKANVPQICMSPNPVPTAVWRRVHPSVLILQNQVDWTGSLSRSHPIYTGSIKV